MDYEAARRVKNLLEQAQDELRDVKPKDQLDELRRNRATHAIAVASHALMQIVNRYDPDNQ